MNIIKRNGEQVPYDGSKIKAAISKANKSVANPKDRLTNKEIDVIEERVLDALSAMTHSAGVEEIQDMVITNIYRMDKPVVGSSYAIYRYVHEQARKGIIDEPVFAQSIALLDMKNDDAKAENANKNVTYLSTQRDYMAGFVDKLLVDKFYYADPEIVEYHASGKGHNHDADYTAMRMTNCGLVNMDDCLQNGTEISGRHINKPRSFRSACTIATQMIAQTASLQYGGQTFNLAHLIPFVEVSRRRLRRKCIKKYEKKLGILPSDNTHTSIESEVKTYVAAARTPKTDFPDAETEYKGHEAVLPYRDEIEAMIDIDLRDEISDGIQCIQYQLITLMTTNGQAPFVSMYINIEELADNEPAQQDMAMVIREVLLQRIVGVPNEDGVFLPTAFPKILYVLDENNKPGKKFAETDNEPKSKFWDLTYLAAICSASVMTPDYISAKQMRALKNGDVYACMGCVDGESVIDYKDINGTRYVESFENAWNRLSIMYDVKVQPNGKDVYIDTDGIEIFDNAAGRYVKQYRIIRNKQSDWYRISFTGGRSIDVTDNHPFEVENKGIVLAKDLSIDDTVQRLTAKSTNSEPNTVRDEQAWLTGLLLCDSSYAGSVTISLGNDETDICNHAASVLKSMGYDTTPNYRERGQKGCYIDLYVMKASKLHKDLIVEFNGVKKSDRQIPISIWNSNRNVKLSFLAGMIDADGYVNNANNTVRVQLGSTNEKLAMEQMLLAIDIGLDAVIYPNHYYKNDASKVRYRVEFNCTTELANLLVSKKKQLHSNGNHKFYANTMSSSKLCSVVNIEYHHESKFSYDVTTETEHFMVNGIYSHNCRSFLTVDRFSEKYGNIANAKNYKPGTHKYWGRFNCGVSSVSLPHAALSSGGDFNKFWEILNERVEINHKFLQKRIERLRGTPSDVAPLLWQHGVYARLKPGETIDKLLYHGYATISLGYAGLYECVKYTTGHSHMEDGIGKEFGIKVLQFLNDKCAEWRDAEDIDYSLYGTPMESTTYKFAKALQRDFGIIPGITDKNYITNSYHQHVTEKTDGFTKLAREAQFQKLSPGGAISYIEMPDMQGNIPAVMAYIQFIYDTIMYAEFNIKKDYCKVCGFEGTIDILRDEESKKFYWKCPHCGNTDRDKMHIFRRMCGYPGENECNQGRYNEFADRVLHVDQREMPIDMSEK